MFQRSLQLVFLCFMIFLAGCQSPFVKEEKEPFLRTDKDDTIRVLVVGIDSRGEKKSRTDSIMYLQYDKKSSNAKIISIMRDTYVKIPGYRDNKINTAYFLGEMPLLATTLKENFNLTFDHYAVVDFKGFIHVIDTIAPEGVEVEVTPDMIADFNLPLQPGVQKLHGEELLKVARFRHDNLSDFGRVARQQDILKELEEQLIAKAQTVDGMLELSTMVRKVLGEVDTDLSTVEALTLASSILFNNISSIDTMRIPVANGYRNATYPHAGMVLELVDKKNTDAIETFLSTTPAEKK